MTIVTIVATSVLVFYSNKFLNNESLKLDNARSMSQKNTLLDVKYRQISTNSLYWQEPSRDLYTTVTNMLPTQKGQADAVSLIQQLVGENYSGLRLNSITFPSSELGAKTAATAPTANAGGTTPTPTPTPTAATAKITQSKPIKDVTGILAIETKISLKPPTGSDAIDYESFLKFLDGLTNNTRLMQVTELSVSPDLKGADIIVNILIKQ